MEPAQTQERYDLIRQIEKARGSKVICYVTSTRVNLESQMSMDVIPIVYEHVRLLDGKPADTKIDILIHSNGGDGVVPWRLVTLLRQYCAELTLLVPCHAYSAATLLALGADKVLMHPMGVLGPIDPTVVTPYNPPDPQNPNRKLGVSVEDVAAFFALVREDVGINHEDELVQALLALANVNVVHPLALGSVKRSTAQGRMLGKKLLQSRKHGQMEDHEIAEVVNTLTSQLYYHGHPINWEEARNQLGLKFVDRADDDLAKLMWELFSGYAAAFSLNEPFDQTVEVARANQLPVPPGPPGPGSTGWNVSQVDAGPYPTVSVESSMRSDYFEVKLDIVARREWTGQLQTLLAVTDQGWRRGPAPSSPAAKAGARKAARGSGARVETDRQ